MGDRYWVGGTAAWDATAGTKWSTTSGGAGGAAVPTAADDVFFDAASGTVTVTPSAAYPYILPCRSINFTGFTGTFAMTSGLFLTIGDGTAGAGNIALKFSATMTVTYANGPTIDFVSTSATQQTVDFAGKTTSSVRFIRAGSWQYTGAHTCTGTLSQSAGTLDTNGQALSIANLSVIAGTFNPSTSAITITGTANGSLSLGPSATYTANTAVFTLNGNGGGASAQGVNTNGMSLVLNYTGVSNQVTGGTWLNVTRTGGAVKTAVFQVRGDFTCTGTFAANGNSAVNRVLVYSDALGTARTITASTVSCSNVDFRDITGAGAGSWNLAAITGNSGDCGGNSGITFTAATTQTATGTANFTWSTHGWTTRVPLPQDTALIPNAFVASRAVTMDMPRVGTVDFTGCTGAPTVTMTGTAEIYGDLTYAAGMGPITYVPNPYFIGAATQTLTMAGNSFLGNGVVVVARSKLRLADTWVATTTGLLTSGSGYIDTQNNNCALNYVLPGNTSNVNLWGTSTITIAYTLAATVLSLTAARNDAANATFVISAASSSTRTVALGASSIGTLTYTVASSPGALAITGGGTIGTLNVGSGRTLTQTSSTALNVTNWNVNGTVIANNGLVIPSATGAATTPSTSAWLPSTQLEVVARVSSDDWTPSTTRYLVGRQGNSAVYSNFVVGISNSVAGRMFLLHSNGTTNSSYNSTSTPPFVDGSTFYWLKYTWRSSDGRIQFFYAADQSTEPSAWTQVGADVTGPTTSMNAAPTALCEIGGNVTIPRPWGGVIKRVIVRTTIGGAAGFDADFTTRAWCADTFVESIASAVVTLVGSEALMSDGRVTINTSTSGTFATLSVASGTVTSTNVVIKDNHATGGATFTAIDSISISGNTGWNFVSGWVPKSIMIM